MTFLSQRIALTFVLAATLGCAAPETGQNPGRPAPAEQTTDDSTPQQSASAPLSLPEGFPSDFPLPPDFEIRESRFVEGDFATRANYLVRGQSPAGISELVDLYRDRLPAAGFTLIQQPPEPFESGNAMFYFRNQAYSDCSVQLNQQDDGTDVLINLPLRD